MQALYSWHAFSDKLIKAEYHAYRQTATISHTLVGNKIVDHSDVVGAVLRGDAPTPSEWSTILSSFSI